jgi:hypothetical protein
MRLEGVHRQANQAIRLPREADGSRQPYHDFKKLLERAGLRLIHNMAMDQAEFANYWKTVAEWNAASRYGNHSMQMAEELINAIANRRFGVLPWLTRHY